MTSIKLRVIPLCLALAVFIAGPVAASDDDHQGDDNHQGDQGGGKPGKPGKGDHLKNGNKNDFALFDGSNPLNQPDAGAVCGDKKAQPFTFHVTVANFGSDGFLRVTYVDGDFIQIPLAAGGSFSMTQAAGSKGGNDAAVRVSNGGSAAQLAGAISAEGGKCASCDADGGIGDAGCDKFVPN
jgi:hypothetical protein